ncbi:MAG: methylmalonyl Co-A mutase-associated GTPase MeaB [Candidatus Hodarchaeota archaeon]
MNNSLVKKVLAGNTRAIARMISNVENRSKKARDYITKIFPHTGNAVICGITGPPGCGKSTLVNKLALALRKRGKKIGIIAVDPSSPFTHGALLGDRIRMQELYEDKEVFIRSMGSRGALGGLSRASRDAIRILDAAGKDIILVETVGIGQAEVDIVRTVQTCIVLTVPGLGDDIQAIKAGILEIGDIFVVNKADRADANRTYQELEIMLSLSPKMENWRPPIIKTVATKREGISELIDAIENHQSTIRTTGMLKERELQNYQEELTSLMSERLLHHIIKPEQDSSLDSLLEQILARKLDPHTAITQILENMGVWTP